MSFVWTDAESLGRCLAQHADEKYRDFHSGLIPGGGEILGVRMPVLKSLARDITKGDWRDFLDNCPERYHEERMLKGMVTAMAKCPAEERIERIRAFVPTIDNWALCDCFCTALKEADRRQEEYFALLCEYLSSTEEYQLRFAAVMLLCHFVNSVYIDKVLEIYQHISHDGYYVKMAVAWGLSVCYVKFPGQTLEVFKGGRLDDFTQNKAIQKCRESLRVSQEDKEMLKRLKR